MGRADPGHSLGEILRRSPTTLTKFYPAWETFWRPLRLRLAVNQHLITSGFDFLQANMEENSLAKAGLEERFVPGDPLYDSQWHLHGAAVPAGGAPAVNIDVESVWDDYTGAGVAVAVYDDGVDYNHPDLRPNYDFARQVTINGVVEDPLPANWNSLANGGDSHGTAVAGLIAAADNGIGGVGVAYHARLTGVALLRSATDADMIESLDQQSSFDVVNHSWGFSHSFAADYSSGEPIWTAFQQTMADAADFGRNGLGTIVVNAAGNSRSEGYDVNYDNFTNDRHVIAVGAVGQSGSVSWYSTPGAALLVVAPSNNTSSEAGIVTTDLSGSAGDAPGDYRSDFGGTSAASPIVSGVDALVLNANPNLGWRDVQEVLAYSARHVGTEIGSAPSNYELYRWGFNGAENWNGGGLHFSNDYGFGLVNAHDAVRLAESWNVQSTSFNEWTPLKTARAEGVGLIHSCFG